MSKIRIDPTLYKGRPSDNTNRLPTEMKVYDFLDQLSVPYQRLDHDATPSIEECEEIENNLGVKVCKNLFLCNRQKTQFYLLLMPGHKPFRTKELSHQIGTARLSFADAAFMEQFLQTTPGSASVLGLLFDSNHAVQLLIDRDLLEEIFFGCHPCINTSSLRIKTHDLLEAILPALGVTPTFVTLSSAPAEEGYS